MFPSGTNSGARRREHRYIEKLLQYLCQSEVVQCSQVGLVPFVTIVTKCKALSAALSLAQLLPILLY